MSIKPVDYNTLLPKAQELSKIRQLENNKLKVQIEQRFVQQNHKIERNFNRVNNTNKSEETKINTNKKKDRENKHREQQNMKDNQNTDEQIVKEKKDSLNVGNNIDIRI